MSLPKRIFIRGDVGHLPNGCRIFDADTMQELMVKSFVLHAGVNHSTWASVTALMQQVSAANPHGEVSGDVDVVPDPEAPPTGRMLYELEYSILMDAAHLSYTRNQLSLYGWTVKDGAVVREPSSDMIAQHDVADSARAVDPDGAQRACLDDMGRKLGLAIAARYGPTTPLSINTALATPVACPECFGTGYHKGFGAPCSQGCAVP